MGLSLIFCAGADAEAPKKSKKEPNGLLLHRFMEVSL